ncbi:MAG: hypothetical protein EBR09_08975 [Proteobacteria bacterium]|nr:hypothetical protein [Pseudomonadota bacterium]
MTITLSARRICCALLSVAGVALSGTAVSCGKTERTSTKRISSGSVVGDQVINGVRTQLKIRQAATQDAIFNYLSAAGVSSSLLNLEGIPNLLPLSAESIAFAKLSYGLSKEIAALEGTYSFAVTPATEHALKIRASIVRYSMFYGRQFSNLDTASNPLKAEFARAFSFGFISGFPSAGLSSDAATAGLTEVLDSLLSGIADTKWDDAALLNVYGAYATGALSGLKSTSLDAAARSTLVDKIVGDSYTKLKDNKTSKELRLTALLTKMSSEIGLLKTAGFSAGDIPNALVAIVTSGLTALKANETAFETDSKNASGLVSREVLKNFSDSMSNAELAEIFKAVAAAFVAEFKTINKTLPADFADGVKAKMNEAIQASSVGDSKKSDAVCATDKGITKAVTGTDPDPPATCTPAPALVPE